jgi:SnoaL-like polyketide cyclase
MDEHIGWQVVPLGLRRQGKEQMRQPTEGRWADAPPDGWHEITNIFASEDWACLEYTARGTMTKQLPHLNISYQPSGQQMEIRAVDVFQMKDGKISLARSITTRRL